MIKISMNKGKVVEAHVTGSGAEIIAEVATIAHNICNHISQAEETETERTLTYAFYMLKIADCIVHLTEENNKVSDLLKSIE